MERNLNAQQNRINGDWNQIWRIKMPPRIKIFLRRATRGCLPTRVRLQTRGVTCPVHCPFCNEPKDSLHALFLCNIISSCWQLSGLRSKISPVIQNQADISVIILEILQRLDHNQRPIFSTLIWSIWKNRNNKVWNDKSEACQAIWDKAKALLASWTNAQKVKQRMSITQVTRLIEKWTKPSLDRYKCNVDASFSEPLDMVGIGICIRDEEGAFVLAWTEWFSPITDVDIGEALGLLKALEWVRDLHKWNMDFEVDSKTMADNIYRSHESVSEFSEITNNYAHLLCTDLMNSDVKFIRRQANKVAHSLAKSALLEASFRIHYNIPSCIENILINEIH